MGKHFSMKHLGDESHDKQPGCSMWGLVHVLDYHHWQSNVRKMIQHRKYDKCDWTPVTEMHSHDAYDEEKENPNLNAKISPATKKRSLKARLKALIVEEISTESESTKRKEGFSFKSKKLQRTYSIHNLESLDGGFGNWKHPIIFFPRNVENRATLSSNTIQTNNAGNQESRREICNMGSSKNAAKSDPEEEPDVLEIFKVDKKMLIKHLQDADESIVNFSRSALGLNTKAKLSKSRSFPEAEFSQRRKLKPIQLENKQKEVWSFPKQDKLQSVNQAPRSDCAGYFGARSGELAGDESNGILWQDIMIKQDKSPACGSSELNADRKSKNAIGRSGEKLNENDSRRNNHRRSSSLNESMDKYAWMLDNSFQREAKLNLSKSLKLKNEYRHVPMYVGRIRSLSNVDSYYSNSIFEVLGDDPSGNGSVVTAKDSSSALQNSEVEKEDDASLRWHTSDVLCEKIGDLEEEADELKKTDSSKETESQKFVLSSEIYLQETESYAVEIQISQDLESRYFDCNELKSLENKPLSPYCILNLENDKMSNKIIKNFEHDELPKKNDLDLFYVRHLLDRSGIEVDASEMIWHASDQPLSPQLFEEMEGCWPHERDQLTEWPDLSGCWHHQMLFDLVNEVLLEVYDMSLPYYPKALSSSCRVRPFPVGNHITNEVSRSIGTLLDMKTDEKQSLDCIVARDLARDQSWMNLQLETECLALDLEDIIFNELLEEVTFF